MVALTSRARLRGARSQRQCVRHARGEPRAWSASIHRGRVAPCRERVAGLVHRSGERLGSASTHRVGARPALARPVRLAGGRLEASVRCPGGWSRPGACAWPRFRHDCHEVEHDRACGRSCRRRCARGRRWWSARRRRSWRRCDPRSPRPLCVSHPGRGCLLCVEHRERNRSRCGVCSSPKRRREPRLRMFVMKRQHGAPCCRWLAPFEQEQHGSRASRAADPPAGHRLGNSGSVASPNSLLWDWVRCAERVATRRHALKPAKTISRNAAGSSRIIDAASEARCVTSPPK